MFSFLKLLISLKEGGVNQLIYSKLKAATFIKEVIVNNG
jgi:hypothetical protein